MNERNASRLIAAQRELILGLARVEDRRIKAEGQALVRSRQEQVDAEARATQARAQAEALRVRAQALQQEAGQVARLPSSAYTPDEAEGQPFEQLTVAVETLPRLLADIRAAVATLDRFRVARAAARYIAVIAAAAIVILAAIAGAQIHKAAQARAQVQATATAQAIAQATAEAQAQAMSQELGLSVPSLAFSGLEHNADWTPVLRDFDGVPMALVPAGCYMMGDEDWTSAERPAHLVCFESPFWLDVYEVTNAQFASWGGVAEQSSKWTEPQRPREQITWQEAADFCAQRGARLPTEAEWEYAARGPDGLTYPWGNAFVWGNVVYEGNSRQRTGDVGSKPGGVSWVGAYDLSGNISEWVNDWYDADYYGVSPVQDPPGPVSGEYRVLRGGAWNGNGNIMRAARRYYGTPDSWGTADGFRCARSE